MMEVRFDNGDTMFAVVKPKAPDAPGRQYLHGKGLLQREIEP